MSVKSMYAANTAYTTDDLKRLNKTLVNGKTIFKGIGNGLVVNAQTTPDMSISVASGFCGSAGLFVYNSSSLTIDVPSNNATYPRIDAVVVYCVSSTPTIKLLKGTASATPSAPDCTASEYIKLAEVYVGAGVSSIQTSNITDCRENVIDSLADSVIDIVAKMKDLYKYRVEYSTGAVDRGYRKCADGFTYCWNSGIQAILGNALSIYVNLAYTFTNPASCRVTCRLIDTNDIPHVVNCRLENDGNTVLIHYPSASVPQLANGNCAWYVQVEGF